MKYLIIFLLTIQTAYGGNAIKVKTGDVVPKEFNEGTLMDKDTSEKVRDELIEKDALVKTNESLNKTIILHRSNENILTEQNKLLLDQNLNLTKTLNETRETSTIVKIGYFLGGVIITGAAVYGASKLVR
jgi:hypothetical protein